MTSYIINIMTSYIINEILKSPLPIYLDINEENIFYKETDKIIVIIRGANFSKEEREYILNYLENNKDIMRVLKNIYIVENKVKLHILFPIS